MRFLKLNIQNFMSIQKAEIRLDGRGLVLVQGRNEDDSAFDSNGAGKSTVFEALTYVLFDKTVRGLKGDEVINNNSGKNCAVILDLIDDKGIPYKISRYRKHKEYKNNVLVYRAENNVTSKSSKDTNLFIESLIQMDYDTFTNSILFGQGLIKMFSVASDNEKKAILEKMLSLTVFKEAQDAAKVQVSDLKTKIAAATHNLDRTKYLKSEVEATVANLKEREKEHREKTSKEISILKNGLQEALTEKEKELALFEKVDDEVDQLLREIHEEEKKLESYKKYEESRDQLEKKNREAGYEMDRLDREIAELEIDVKRVKAGTTRKCPACGQDIKGKDDIAGTLRHIADSLKKKFEEKEQAYTEVKKSYALIKRLNDTVIAEARTIEAGIKDIKEKIVEKRAFTKMRDNVLQGYDRRTKDYLDRIKTLEAEADKTFAPMIEEKTNRLHEIKDSIDQLERETHTLKKELSLVEFWVDAFGNSGIKSYLLDSVTPFLNERANYYLSKLAGGTTEITFSTQTTLKSGEKREKFEVQINNLVGGESYDSNSSGERRRIDLAISLALQDLVMSRSNAKMNVLLYDEVFDSLDATGCENAILLLSEVQKNVESVFVITHNDNLKTYFDKSMTVVKSNGMSTVEMED